MNGKAYQRIEDHTNKWSKTVWIGNQNTISLHYVNNYFQIPALSFVASPYLLNEIKNCPTVNLFVRKHMKF